MKKMLLQLILLLVVLTSGNPAVDLVGYYVALFATLALMVLYTALYAVRVGRKDSYILFLFSAISLIHVLTFGMVVVPAVMGFISKLIVALLAVRIVSDFDVRFVSLMYILSWISFVFYLPVVLGVDPGLFSFMHIPLPGVNAYNIGMHNFNHGGYYDYIHRNSGMFWEPGAFAGYLAIALLLMLSKREKLPKAKVAVLVVALLTTQSTTGYVALFLLTTIFFLYRNNNINVSGRWLFVSATMSLLMIAGYSAYTYLPFMQEKINSQVESAEYRSVGYETNRMGNFTSDMQYVEVHPLFGWSPRRDTRLVENPNVVQLNAQGNGLSGFLVSEGVVGLGLYIFFVYRNFYSFFKKKYLGILATSVILVLLFGEQFMNYPLFLAMMFLSGAGLNKKVVLTRTHLINIV